MSGLFRLIVGIVIFDFRLLGKPEHVPDVGALSLLRTRECPTRWPVPITSEIADGKARTSINTALASRPRNPLSPRHWAKIAFSRACSDSYIGDITMSGSSLSDPPASEETLENALRSAVRSVYRKGDLEDLTLKRLRKAAEQDLGLESDFFKNDATWKIRSKSVIESEVVRKRTWSTRSKQLIASQEARADEKTASEPALSRQSPNIEREKPVLESSASKGSRGTKRNSPPEGRPRKRRKTDDKIFSQEAAKVESENSTKGDDGAGAHASDPSPNKEDEATSPNVDTTNGKGPDSAIQDSESELSSLLDENPQPKKKGGRSKSESSKPKEAKTTKSGKRALKGSRKAETSVDPDTAEIKRLQGWLIKCGIRKIWHRELSNCDGPKAKVRHLKQMLTDAGMTGRYSAEKANSIKEERELKADLEAVQAGNKHWGKGESDEGEGSPKKPRRRLAKGLKELDFLGDEDGEETD